MKQHYLVRYGWQREIGKVALSDSHLIDDERLLRQRGQRVVIDCGRGSEVGECLGCCPADSTIPVGKLFRFMAPDDELFMGQLAHLAQLAYERCVAWLEQADLHHVLLQVEPLIDGKTLLFHFLDNPDALVQEHLDYLVGLYEQEVRQSEFAQKLEAGCGPDCGTSKANCSSHCSSCNSVKCHVQQR